MWMCRLFLNRNRINSLNPLWMKQGRTITASDFRKTRQKALAEELIKPKYQAYGFRTVDLLKNLSDHFRNPAQIRYEMNKMKAMEVISKPNNKSFYRVTETGWKWLWLEICSANHLIRQSIRFTRWETCSNPTNFRHHVHRKFPYIQFLCGFSIFYREMFFRLHALTPLRPSRPNAN